MKKIILLILFLTSTVIFSQDSLMLPYKIINSNPQNADVYINEELAGNTPFRVTGGSVTYPVKVKIKMKGYLDYIFTLNQDDVNKNLNLVPINTSRKEKIVTEDKGIFFETKRKIIPIIASSLFTAGGAVLGFYFKALANENYDEYLINGDTGKLDKTRRYDVYSAVSLGLSQIGFAGLIYFLLIDK